MEWLRNRILGSAAFIDFDDATGFYTCSINVIRVLDVAVGERDLVIPAASSVASALPGVPTNAAGNPLPVVGAFLAPQNLTLTENVPILIAVTGKTTTLVNDISFTFGEVNALN